MKILIIGVNSTLGEFLFNKFKDDGYDIYGTSRDKGKLSNNIFFLDISDYQLITKVLNFTNYDYCFFCAGLTNINYCKENIHLANKINFLNTSKIINELINKNIKTIFFSTNLTNIFIQNKNIKKYDIKNNYYALLKYKIEKKYSKKINKIKLSKVIDIKFNLFELWINNLKKGIKINPFSNKTFSPIHINYIFEIICKNLNKFNNETYSYGPTDEISYSEAAYRIAKKLNLNASLISEMTNKFINYNPLIVDNMNIQNFDSLSSIDEYIKCRND